jgi:cysteine desulfurase
VEKVAEICRERRVFFHTDAVQAVGKIPIKLGGSAISFLSLSAHKFHGPKGVGALYVKRNSRFQPSIIGGSQENGRRAGTENVASIVGLGKAAERAAHSIEEEQTRVRRMRDRFENGILECVNGASINGDRAARLPNTSSLSFQGIDSNAALILLDRHEICCSAGSACKSGSSDGSHVLRAMHAEDRAQRSLRFSFGRFNSDIEVDRALEIVPKVIARLSDSSRPQLTKKPMFQSSS